MITVSSFTNAVYMNRRDYPFFDFFNELDYVSENIPILAIQETHSRSEMDVKDGVFRALVNFIFCHMLLYVHTLSRTWNFQNTE